MWWFCRKVSSTGYGRSGAELGGAVVSATVELEEYDGVEDGAAVGVTDGTGVDVAACTLGLEGCDGVEDVAAVGVAVGPGVDGADT